MKSNQKLTKNFKKCASKKLFVFQDNFFYNFSFITQIGKDGKLFNKRYNFCNIPKPNKISKTKQTIISLLCGLFVGFLSGFFGGGGGMIVVPLLIFVLGLDEKEAHATAILTILPISISSSIIYIINNSIEWKNLGFTTLGFVVGGVFGALLLKKLNNKLIRVVFAIVMIFAGIKILI